MREVAGGGGPLLGAMTLGNSMFGDQETIKVEVYSTIKVASFFPFLFFFAVGHY